MMYRWCSPLIALFTVNVSHLHDNVFEHGCEAISGRNCKIARNCLTSTLKNIVMQMRKGNCEKGYCIIKLVPIPSLPKPPVFTALISCQHSCRFSPLRNTGYPMWKLTIHFGNRPAPLTQHNITPLLYKTQLSKQITFTEAWYAPHIHNPSTPTFLHPSKCQSP